MASGFTTTGSDFDGQFIRREFFNEGQLWAWGYNNYGQAFGDHATINICADIRQQNTPKPTNRLYRLLKIRETKRTLLAIKLRTCNLNFDNKNQ